MTDKKEVHYMRPTWDEYFMEVMEAIANGPLVAEAAVAAL